MKWELEALLGPFLPDRRRHASEIYVHNTSTSQ